MDNYKIGQLILKLRKENQMTQKVLADRLFLSDRTISKWERGVGCPDVSILKKLASIFQVEVEELLGGQLTKNATYIGNLKETAFYYCPSCKNIMTSGHDITMKCCGRLLESLETTEETDEYDLEVDRIDDEYLIASNHPMTKMHYIEFLAFIGVTGMILIKLYPEQNVEHTLPYLGKGTLYYYCTQHGFYKKVIG